ncbi:hypothetical protein Tco_0979169 [Tanacetum coccineum]
MQNTMAEQNVPAQAPTRTDEQIVPRSQWLQIGKSNLLFDAQKIQKNPIFQISVDIMRLTGKTSGGDKPRHPVLQMLWGIVTQTNVDHAELLWEEFTQGIQTFFSHKASHEASLKDPKKKAVPLLIPYGRFTKMIIYYLGRQPRMAIPKQLITQAIQQSLYYPKYLEMVAKNTKKTPQDSASKQPEPATKRAPPKKPTTTTLANNQAPPGTRLSLAWISFLPQGQAPVGGVAIRDPVSETTPKLPEVVGKEDQARSDPRKAHEALAGPDPKPMQEDQTRSDSGKVHVSLAGPNPEHTDEEFLATAYPKIESDSTIPDLSHQTVTSTPLVIAPVIDFSSPKPSSHVTTPPITTEATSITTTLPEITPFIALQLRVAKLEQDMSEVKKTDHSAAALASIKSQVPTVVDKYLGTKLDDALLKILERHTADLIEKYSVLRCLEVLSFKHIQKKQETANRNPANYHLYHALMETLIADEDAMDKEVKDRVKDHKRKHDSDDDEDDDDDEGPSAGSNQDLEDTDNAHIPKVTAATWFKPIPEDQRPATPEPEWTIPPNDFPEPENNWANAYATTRTGKKKLNKADLEGPAFNLVKAFHKNNYIEPAALRRPPGQCNYSTTFFFNKDLEYLLTGDKERKTTLSISKLKATRYLDFGLEELVPSLWVKSERDYDISAAYGIIHWWFSRKQFYINKHSEPSDREEQSDPISNSHVIRVKTFEKYGYNYDESRKFFVYLTTKEYKIS